MCMCMCSTYELKFLEKPAYINSVRESTFEARSRATTLYGFAAFVSRSHPREGTVESQRKE